MDDTTAMNRCIELARAAAERGDQPFGSVIVMDGQVVAEGDNSINTDSDVTAHAELVAIRRACQALGRIDLSGGTIYASGEPCWMCSAAIRGAKLSRVVFAVPSSGSTGGATSNYKIMTVGDISGYAAPPEVVERFMEDSVRSLYSDLGWPPKA